MGNKATTVSLAAFLALSLVGNASAQAYACSIERKNQRGPVPLSINVSLISDGNEALIQDEYTRQLSKSSFRVDVPPVYPNRTVLKWKLRGISFLGEENRQIKSGVADYQLTINHKTQKANLSVWTREHKGKYYGEGRCIRK